MNGPTTIIRRRALELLAAATLAATALPYSRAADDKNEKKRKVLLFTKSSGFEHDPVKRKGEDLSLAEKTLTQLGKKHGFEVVATKDGRVFDGDLTQYDAFFFFTTGDLTEAGTTHARDELGISEITTARPVQAALTSAVMFSVGAAMPLLMVVVSPAGALVPIVSAASLGFLALLGAIGAKAGGAHILRATARTFWGALAMALTAGIGRLVGTVV
jgi:hypothetical protein